MIDTKPKLQSLTVWSLLASILVVVGGWLGYSVSEDDARAVVEAVTAIVTISLQLIAIYGRIRATKKLH